MKAPDPLPSPGGRVGPAAPTGARRIADYAARGRDNNFNLIRAIAATLVIWTHAYGFTGHADQEQLKATFGISFGSWAVDVFFALSGFLVSNSWEKNRSVGGFLMARGLRIYPALWVCIALCVLLVGLPFTTLAPADFLVHRDTLKFVVANATLLPVGVTTILPGVFGGEPINSPLWTLPYELKMYLALLALGVSGLLYRPLVVPALLLTALGLFAWGCMENRHEATVPEYARFVYCFFFGAWLYLERARVRLSGAFAAALLGLLVLVVVAGSPTPLRLLLLTAVTPYLSLYLAFVPAGIIRAFNRIGDYSYGLYIYGAPVQLSVLALAGGTMSQGANFLWSVLISLALAMLSWHALEHRVLRFKTRPLKTATPA